MCGPLDSTMPFHPTVLIIIIAQMYNVSAKVEGQDASQEIEIKVRQLVAETMRKQGFTVSRSKQRDTNRCLL